MLENSPGPQPQAEPAPLETTTLPAVTVAFDSIKRPLALREKNKFIEIVTSLSIPEPEAISLIRIADRHNVSPLTALSIMTKTNGNADFVEGILSSSERNIGRGAKGKTAPAKIISDVASIAAVESGFKPKDPDRDLILQLQAPEKKDDHLETSAALRELADHYKGYNISLAIIQELYEQRRSVDLIEDDLAVITSAPLGIHEHEGKLTYFNRVVTLIRTLEDRSTMQMGNGSDLNACEIQDEERDIMTFDEAAYLLGGDFPGFPDLNGLEEEN